MIELWIFNTHRWAAFTFISILLYLNVNFSCSLNDEGLALLRFREKIVSDPFGALANWNDEVGVVDPCSWYGVECSQGKVVVLNLKGLCLGGILAPDVGNLVHIRSIILRNNCFYGIIPEEIVKLKELEVLDLGYNNVSGPLPADIGNNLSLAILLLDNNELFGGISPEFHELTMLSEVQIDENQLSVAALKPSCNRRPFPWNIAQTGGGARRRLLATEHVGRPKISMKGLSILFPPSPVSHEPPLSPSSSPSPQPFPSASPAASPSPFPALESPSSSPSPSPASSGILPAHPVPVPSPKVSPSTSLKISRAKHHRALIYSLAIGGPALLLILALGIFFCQRNKVAVVKPWATGISGQLQKAFVTGVPQLKRSELETACEDFSNVVGSSSLGTVYKGTLSNGVEIAVISLTATSSKDWSKDLETQFRRKMDTLSKVSHKNFVNLIGYCQEEEPFTRMLVFEYAPNGTLFEHLHIKEAEHLDWVLRMRIAMGMAYCLEHMHQLTPPVAHKNLTSSAVYLTEDYAAKISDFGFWNDIAASEVESSPESNVYSFGVILFEIMTGRLPYAVNSGSLEDWASDYLRGDQPLRKMVDPTLKSFEVEQLEKIAEVMNMCVHPDPRQRLPMREVTARLREITAIGPDGAIPKLSPLWWAELEIMSTEAN